MLCFSVLVSRGIQLVAGAVEEAGAAAGAASEAVWARAVPVQTNPTLLAPFRTLTLPPRCGFHADNPLHSVHSLRWLSAADCAFIIAAAETAAAVTGWSTGRHRHYPTNDLELSAVPPIRDFLLPKLCQTVLPTMAALFKLGGPERLRIREIFVVKYEAVGRLASLAAHRDSDVLSFNVLLNDPAAFDGGGTVLDTLGATVRPTAAGEMTMHCGQMLHGGGRVTRGVRYILVAFINVVDPDVQRMLAARAQQAEALVAQGDALAEAGDDLEAAADAYRKAAALVPDDVEAWTSMAFVARRRGRFREAAACFERAVLLAPADSDLLKYREAALREAGEDSEAELCRAATEVAERAAPAERAAVERRTNDYLALHQYWEAIEGRW